MFLWRIALSIFILPVYASQEKGWVSWIWGAESTVSVVDRSPVISFQSRPAAFGEEIEAPILGYVIPLSSFTVPCANQSLHLDAPPNTGCPKLCISGQNEPEPSESWIALVQRGKCEFVAKVREAQRLGARAVVVGGDNPEISGYPDTLVNMFSPEDSSDVTIASTFIKYSDYVQLSHLIATSNTSHSGLRTLSLLIVAEYSAWEWYSPIITFVTILLLPSILTFLTLLLHRVRAARAARRERAPEDIVHNLPWRVWTGTGWEKHEGGNLINSSFVDVEQGLSPKLDAHSPSSVADDVVEDPAEQSNPNPNPNPSPSPSPPSSTAPPGPTGQPWFERQMECAICLSEFEKGDKVRVLPCHHIFHLEEVDEWLIQQKKLCPVCKADVTRPPNDSQEDDGDDDTAEHTPADPNDSDTPTERTPLLRGPDDSLSPT
ncbi:hypothetical protein E1B28_012191 [Marasmius oreades]|uniref:RING-type E3 ubiquitin transferase n=1 Tax=Marasmius oreades TaxID=181124 RepID=A0A9P7RR65_9AGAR|nr:uncharacterized protein E1B28_012191 [Marasmius oreades]KAG7088170.1 hypothetical protein E1B28_012191 [Marasmius oreades]